MSVRTEEIELPTTILVSAPYIRSLGTEQAEHESSVPHQLRMVRHFPFWRRVGKQAARRLNCT